MTTTISTSESKVTFASLPQRRLGRYEVLQRIGEGGMATVFRARLEGPGGACKDVALKLIHPYLSHDPDFVRMFLDETRVAMALSHRNIVQTFDAGELDGQHYLVMELLEGGSLGQLLATPGAGLPLEVALFIGAELAAGLEHLHGLGGMVHRDVSPANVLFSAQGDVKLADFGVVRAAGITSTFGELVKGKLSYMAPEQAAGRAEPRSDLFALGAVLYRMLSGSPLREKATLEAVRGEGPHRLPPQCQVPESLAELVAACLQPAPEQRPSSGRVVEQLGDELERARHLPGATRDVRARLRGLLSPAGDQAGRVAAAMRQLAAQIPTEPGKRPAASSGSVPQGGEDRGPTARPAADAEGGRPPVRAEAVGAGSGPQGRRPWPPLAVALTATALSLAAVLGFLASRGDRRTGGAPPLAASPGRLLDAGPLRPDVRPAVSAEAGTRAQPGGDAGAPVDLRRAEDVATGLLDLNSSPWGEVFVDGKRVGETPLQGLRLRVGVHRVRVVNRASDLVAELRVSIRRGRTSVRWVQLAPAP